MSASDPYAAAREAFFIESRDMLAAMEDALLRLESAPDDDDTLNALFRAAHTIKGSAGMFELSRIVAFTHVVESVLVRVRNGELPADETFLALLLQCGDHISALVDEAQMGPADADTLAANEARSAVLITQLQSYLAPAPAVTAVVAAPAMPASANEELSGTNENWHISVRFGHDVMRHGMDPLAVLRYLTTLGRVVSLHTLIDDMPAREEMDAESCYLGFEIALQSEADRQTLMGAFDFVQDDCVVHMVPPRSQSDAYIALIQSLPENPLRLGEILVHCGCLTEQELARGLARQSEQAAQDTMLPLGQVLLAQDAVQAPVLKAALDKQQKSRDKAAENAFVRVRADKLDRLINLVGELVVAGAGVALRAQRTGDTALHEAAQTSAELVHQIRDEALQLRMVPIAETFGRFNRLVRDISRELGKDITLRIEGGENELDKSMVEKLVDPLTHLVRNAIDHGIEAPEERLAAGKPAQGTVTLSARHESGSCVIDVSDDGGGLKRERILAKATTQGLVPAGKELTDEEIFQFIFAPGFSTAEAVTNLSGRGVGMDVVRQNIEALRGTVSVSSQPGQGSCMSMRLPLTLAIIDGFLVGVSTAQYVVPLEMVVECVDLEELTGDACERNYVNLRGEVLPFVRLRDMFGLAPRAHGRESMVIVQYGTQRAGLVVDELLGEFQTVIKPLSRLFASLRGIGGSTILGSGEVALILDVPALVRDCIQNETRSFEAGMSSN
jgi:two-component system, chemotaxis family, sensor kinase CheA